MKKIIFCLIPLLGACSQTVPQSTVPLDMKTVEEYRQRVASGNTVTDKDEPEEALNQSDKAQKQRAIQVPIHRPRLSPSFGIGYSRGGWGHSGIGVGFGID